MVCLIQCTAQAIALLLKPIKPVAVPLAINDVGFAVAVHVVADDRETRVVHLPVGMPLPLVGIGIDLTQPAIGRKNVGLAVAIDIGHAGAVPVVLTRARVMHLWLGTGEIDPQYA